MKDTGAFVVRFGVIAVANLCWFPSVPLLAEVAGPSAPSQVVINEMMYHPPGDRDDLQFIELLNAGNSVCELSGWRFTKGVKFAFPKGAKLAPGEFLVICRDRAGFKQHYGNDIPLAGQFEGKLSRSGERVELADAEGHVADAVQYGDFAPWPDAADGHSASLERICPIASGDSPSNWAASNLPELEVPAGTPGRANDSYAASVPPVIDEITLSPAPPAPDVPIIVDARVSDPDGVKTVEVIFQVLTSAGLSTEQSLTMEKISGDEHGGHYQASLPAQSEGRLVRYRLRAVGENGGRRSSPPPNDLRRAWSYSTFVNRNPAKIPLGYLLQPSWNSAPQSPQRYDSRTAAPERSRGEDAFIYLPANGGDVQTFDFVQTPRRQGGYKVHFLKDRTLRGMTSVNIIFEFSPRFALAEALSYEVYRLAGVPAELTEHIRLWADGKWQGFHLLIEQPNKAFLARNDRKDTGNLYKLIWYGNGLIGQHEKKTNLTNGHDDLVAAVRGLNNGSAGKKWDFIQQNFNVEEFASYYAVNMCIQNWDGFHNNYFVYHDAGRTERWEIYPWDEDKTWGDYDGASPRFDWYELPLNYGMNGSRRPASLGGPAAGNSFVGWWRAPGHFAGPLLANPQFRQRFLRRLREVAETVFTKDQIFPLIDAMERRLESEVSVRAKLTHQDPARATALFRGHMRSFRNQVIHRRKFILDELNKLPR